MDAGVVHQQRGSVVHMNDNLRFASPPPPRYFFFSRHLLPASTGADGSRGGANGSSSSSSRTTAGAAAASSLTTDRFDGVGGRNNARQGGGGGGGGLSSLSSLPGNAWASAVSASRRLVRAGSERWGSRVAGAPPESSSRPSGSRGAGRRGAGSGGGGGFADGSGYPSNDVDEEMGGRGVGGALGGEGAAEATAAGGRRRQGGGGADDTPRATAAAAVLASLDGPGARRAGTGNGVGGGGSGRSWAASLGLRKSSVFNAGGGDGGDPAGAGGTVGQALGFSGSRGRGAGGPGVGAMGLCGKRTVPRALSAGGGRVFTTLPGESYFRGQQQSGEWNAGATATGAAKPGGGVGGRVDGIATAAVASFVGGAAGGGGGGVGERRSAVGGRDWPRVGDSVRAGRCSLAIVIRPAAGGETGDWAGWRHRPTHRVTRQVRDRAASESRATPYSQFQYRWRSA